MLMVNQLIGFGAKEIAQKTYIGSGSITNDQSTYNFGNFTMPRDGLMIAAVGGKDATASRTFSSFTIGGSAATVHTQSSGNTYCIGIASRVVLAGAHNITVTYSGGLNRSTVFVWCLSNYLSATPFGTNSANRGSTGFINLSLNYPVNGIGFYIAMSNTSDTIGWSEAIQENQFTSEIRFAAATKFLPAGATSNIETITLPQSGAVAGATWS